MNIIYLSLGSNEGDRLDWLNKAVQFIATSCGSISNQSGIYETAAWGISEQPNFFNKCIELHTTKLPFELLSDIHKIEVALGRQRTIKWGPRTLDIDILFYNHEIITQPNLTIPHPYLHLRRFTLLPLANIAPNFMHPILNKTVNQLLDECEDTLEVKEIVVLNMGN